MSIGDPTGPIDGLGVPVAPVGFAVGIGVSLGVGDEVSAIGLFVGLEVIGLAVGSWVVGFIVGSCVGCNPGLVEEMNNMHGW